MNCGRSWSKIYHID